MSTAKPQQISYSHKRQLAVSREANSATLASPPPGFTCRRRRTARMEIIDLFAELDPHSSPLCPLFTSFTAPSPVCDVTHWSGAVLLSNADKRAARTRWRRPAEEGWHGGRITQAACAHDPSPSAPQSSQGDMAGCLLSSSAFIITVWFPGTCRDVTPSVLHTFVSPSSVCGAGGSPTQTLTHVEENGHWIT
ncbi:hypothetical protein AOLI_G00115370 [Acnodon oligacanthus]